MIVDSSALIAILLRELERERISAAIVDAKQPRIGAPTLLEASMVVQGRAGDRGAADLDLLMADLQLEVLPFTPEHATIAREAFRRFGKGRHPAGLNFGDCMAYALAKATGKPLLFKGADFSRTDIQAVPY